MTIIKTNTADIQTIKLLPEHLIDQIKAGEVVERPSSLVKELLENSIDANSSKIEIQIIDNGLELICVEDNGKGISFHDLPYAFCRHATSKIERYEDLYKLNSYGFRGEALASIASSSKLLCQSTPLDLTNGGRIEIDGGRQVTLNPLPNNKNGTSIYIRELFYNTPARLKFIKSKQSEKNSLKRIINSFLIANPSIDFSIKWDDKEKLIYKSLPKGQLEKRLCKIFFNNKKNHLPLHMFNAEYEGNKIRGFLSQESGRGNAGKSHFLFANNRLFNDKSLHQAILRNAKDLWGEGNTGHYAVFISTPPSEIDVNVHPNKIQIKFFKSSTIYSLLSSMISRSISEQIEAEVLKPQINSGNLSMPSPLHIIENSFNISSSESTEGTFLEKTNTEIIKGYLISNKYSIIELAAQNWIVDNYRLYSRFWNTLQPNETTITPLLISEPFYCKESIESSSKYLETKGLEFERVNKDLVLLKTIPEEINGFSLSSFITPFFYFYLKKSSNNLHQHIEESHPQCFNSINEVNNILKLTSVNLLQDKKIIVALTETHISNLFSLT